MKTPLLLSVALLLGSFSANAGNMFGPAPFRNGSPLTTGNDGSYQATARAENLTGIFRFAYSRGSQTTNPTQNSWIFFINGQIQKGSVVASLSESSLTGILDADTATSSNVNETVSLPYIKIYQNNNSAGTFSGNLQLNSPTGAFSGDGSIEGIDDVDGQVFVVDSVEVTVGTVPPVTTTTTQATVNPYTLAGGNIPKASFKFRGVRTSTGIATAAPNPATAN